MCACVRVRACGRGGGGAHAPAHVRVRRSPCGTSRGPLPHPPRTPSCPEARPHLLCLRHRLRLLHQLLLPREHGRAQLLRHRNCLRVAECAEVLGEVEHVTTRGRRCLPLLTGRAAAAGMLRLCTAARLLLLLPAAALWLLKPVCVVGVRLPAAVCGTWLRLRLRLLRGRALP